MSQLPATLKNMTLFGDGESYAGKVPECNIPKLARKMEAYRGGGMGGEVDIDIGQEKIEFEWTGAELLESALKTYGTPTVDGVQLRFVGAYQNDRTGAYDGWEVVVRGRHAEIDPGAQKVGSITEAKFKTTCSYYKLSKNDVALIEIDLLGMVFKVNGVDRLAEERRILGLN